MIEGLDALLVDQNQPGVSGLGNHLNEFISEHYGSGQLMLQEKIKSNVYRLHFELEDNILTLILKCMEGRIAQRSDLVARRWLPLVGLTEAGPPLLTTVGTPDGQSVWHIYEDLGPQSLADTMDNAQAVAATVRFIADFHKRFIDHPYMAEFRLYGGDLGNHFVESNLRDAILSLEAITKYRETKENDWTVVGRLLERLSALAREIPSQQKMMKELSGPETLLHGDLWPSNVFVLPDGQVRLIDWDRAGAGPIAYDLSTFILRFPSKQRHRVMEVYREVNATNWEIPDYKDLNLVFETFEYARYACLMIWPAIALGESGVAWALEQLEEIERWFNAWEPIFPIFEDAA
jgi:Phosphotransferase enzyme family